MIEEKYFGSTNFLGKQSMASRNNELTGAPLLDLSDALKLMYSLRHYINWNQLKKSKNF